MANEQNGRTWKLDTAGATSVKTGPIFIVKMRWLPNAAGNTLTVLDTRGDTIWTKTAIAATAAGDEAWLNTNPNMPFDGFNLSAMNAGGILYVTVG